VSAGCVHQKASVALASGFLLGSLAFGGGIEYAIGALSGILLSPDLDVDNGNLSNTVIRNRLGAIPEKAWDALWYFYRKSLKHGSELSHFPVVSTLFRLAYLYFFLLVIPYLILEIVAPGAWSIQQELQWWYQKIIEHYKIILGLMGSDLIHYVLDILTTEHVKKKKKIMIFGMPLASSTCK
jgi:uncharacterized metal-binding protein